jgi:hypothetical protein
MAANGVNAIRTYTVPHVWLLDAAMFPSLTERLSRKPWAMLSQL